MEQFLAGSGERLDVGLELLNYHAGDLVVFMGRAYVIAAILDLEPPVDDDWSAGIYFSLRSYDRPRALNLIVPASLLDRPHHLAA